MTRILQDLRLAFRALMRLRAVNAFAVVAFALGIGITTAVFSLFYGVLLKPLPYPNPGELAILYDTAIQHGDGDDPDGLAALIVETTDLAGGSPATGVPVERWTSTFLDVRRRHLAFAADAATRAGWAESVDRVDALRGLLDSGVLMLDAPFVFAAQGDTFPIR